MAILSEQKEHEAKIIFTNQRLSAEYVSTAPSRDLPHTSSCWWSLIFKMVKESEDHQN